MSPARKRLDRSTDRARRGVVLPSLGIVGKVPLSALDGAPWTPGHQYFLHTDESGQEFAVPFRGWEKTSATVNVLSVGDGFVVEQCRVRTVEEFEWPGPIHRFRIVPPRGAGWERDEKADQHADKFSAWVRRRTLAAKGVSE